MASRMFVENLSIIKKGFAKISQEVEKDSNRIQEKQEKIKEEIKRGGRRTSGFIV